ncbi:MAG TPA: glycosyltransferase family 4 protein [Nitrospiria bacterium]
MNILHLDTERTWRGGEAQVLHLAAGLADRGHRSVVAGQPGSPLLVRAAEKGLLTEAVLMPSEWSLRAVLAIGRLIKKHGIQVIHMHSSHACTLGGWAGRLNRVQVRVISRRVDFSLRSNPLRRLKYQWGIDRILAISEGVKRVLVGDGLDPDKIDIVHSGIDLSPFNPDESGSEARGEFGIPPHAPVVGCVAHFADHKGHRYLIEAAVEMIQKRPDIRLLLVGDGELRHQTELQAKSLGLGEQVIFAGFREDVPRLLAAMDLVVLSSHLEGLGTSLLDAMAMAKPVVGTRVGGIPEMIEEGVNGSLVPPRDPAALSVSILKLLEDPGKLKKMGRAGRENVLKNFSAESMVIKTERIYREILIKKEGPSGA